MVKENVHKILMKRHVEIAHTVIYNTTKVVLRNIKMNLTSAREKLKDAQGKDQHSLICASWSNEIECSVYIPLKRV